MSNWVRRNWRRLLVIGLGLVLVVIPFYYEAVRPRSCMVPTTADYQTALVAMVASAGLMLVIFGIYLFFMEGPE